MLNLTDTPHRRYNILTGEWVLVSPHRNKRPWQGKTENPTPRNRLHYDPNCYLCPGNTRTEGEQNPIYADTHVFPNDFAALLPDSELEAYEKGLLKAQGECGICRVICFSPDHALTIPDMEVFAIKKIVDLWQEQYLDLGSKKIINHVQIFENKGEVMGCSNPHPHGQIWAQNTIPEEVSKKSKQQLKHWEQMQRSLLSDYLREELADGERIVCQNEHFAALVPFWAAWPFESMIISKRHFQHIGQMTEEEKESFAAIIKNLTQRFDRLFDTSFPYSAGIHQSPTDGEEHDEWHFHMAFYPPLLRSATVKKFMVGYEMFANPQRDITAETAAARLKDAGT